MVPGGFINDPSIRFATQITQDERLGYLPARGPFEKSQDECSGQLSARPECARSACIE
jgi:hypothetical protein